jgi:hypothetical protein
MNLWLGRETGHNQAKTGGSSHNNDVGRPATTTTGHNRKIGHSNNGPE